MTVTEERPIEISPGWINWPEGSGRRLLGAMDRAHKWATDLNRETGIAARTINSWVRGNPKHVQRRKLQPICDALGVTIEHLTDQRKRSER